MLVLLVGLAGGTVLIAVAGARRTASSFDRFRREARAADLTLNASGLDLEGLDRVERLPQVEALARMAVMFLSMGPSAVDSSGVSFVAAVDGHLGMTVDRPRLVAGRMPDPEAADEVIVSEGTAGILAAEAGDVIEPFMFPQAQSEDSPPVPRAETTVRLRVVGIGQVPSEISVGSGEQNNPVAENGFVVLTPAFFRTYRDQVGFYDGLARVRLFPGSDVPTFTTAVSAIYGNVSEQFFESTEAEVSGVEDAIDVLTTGLAVFALIAAFASLVIVGGSVGRQVYVGAAESETLRSLGMVRWDRVVVLAAFAVPVAVGGAVLAAVVAIAASPLMPIGLARAAEPDPGLSVDPAVLVVGSGAIALLVVGLTGVVAWRCTRHSRDGAGTHGRSTGLTRVVVGRLARTGAPAPVVVGAQMAFEPGREAAEPRSLALAGAIAGIAGIVGAIVFSAGLDRLLTTPRLYGWNWDVTLTSDTLSPRDLVANPDIAALSAVVRADVSVEGRPTVGLGFESLKGPTGLVIVEGSEPHGPDEVALGTDTLDRLIPSRAIGDSVEVTGPTASRELLIVGRTVFPVGPLADGVVMTREGFERLGGNEFPGLESSFLARWAEGVDHDAALIDLGLNGGATVDPERPSEVANLTGIERLPLALSVLLAVLAGIAVGHGLVTAVHRRARDLAVLKAVGFVPRQLGATIVGQANTIAAVGLAVGIPIGWLVGQLAWTRVADGLGIATDIPAPLLEVLVLIAAVVLATNIIAAAPARTAAHTQVGPVLRGE